jgi:hypothetical protein
LLLPTRETPPEVSAPRLAKTEFVARTVVLAVAVTRRVAVSTVQWNQFPEKEPLLMLIGYCTPASRVLSTVRVAPPPPLPLPLPLTTMPRMQSTSCEWPRVPSDPVTPSKRMASCAWRNRRLARLGLV